ncbi:hypothetical protein HUE87_07385 [Candidatus Sulfurimonas marisnigri]|uniref:Uncharacterized protein n=1 Tax=Candidatus Sulfurimonas marisnigri TaxID=2740405 RepID=A0A7S7RPL3_9BACT|nr:hypothetical protein [Candidatus Sulfurimonas marisnigri]QOY53726.1 hypothetical protein HUE87_07385 [Candidatus Sulfurimonas marisnigri]
MKNFSEYTIFENIEMQTKKALMETINGLSDNLVISHIMGTYKSYTGKPITFQDILNQVDDILYGDNGGEASLATLQCAENFKRNFSSAYLDIQKNNIEYSAGLLEQNKSVTDVAFLA